MSGVDVKDYGKSSRYYEDEYEAYKKDAEAVEKSKKTMVWIQEFSKKVTTVIFIVYILMTAFNAAMIYISMKLTGMTSGLETMITETNETFRNVVGGYLIKAGIENAVKIGGNYYVGVADAKLRALRDRIAVSTGLAPASDDDDHVVYEEPPVTTSAPMHSPKPDPIAEGIEEGNNFGRNDILVNYNNTNEFDED